ncbi:MAG: ribonuclease PH [Myxococcales bacterium]|nr:ribonuclease PH [Myxococcales bacterium]
MPRAQNRGLLEHRPVEVVTGFHRFAEGSVLYRAGGTRVLCAASLDESVPKWMAGQGRGWVTAEYQMHPRANPERREARDGRDAPLKSRTHEIQRLIGRALRSAVDLGALGERTLSIDCDVLEADGGTRTASVTGGFIALALAAHARGLRGFLRDQVAAVSVGYVADEVYVDLDYREDSAARVDMNVVASAQGELVEVQATAEGRPLPQPIFLRMLAAGLEGVSALCGVERAALAGAGVDLDTLLAARG